MPSAPPPSESTKDLLGYEVARHPASVVLSWNNFKPEELVIFPLMLPLLVLLYAIVIRRGEPASQLLFFGAIFVSILALAAWQSLRKVTVHVDPEDLRVQEKHLLGFSTSRHVLRADLRDLHVSGTNLVAVVGPDSKKKVVVRALKSKAAARTAEAELKYWLSTVDDSTGRSGNPIDAWKQLPGDGR